VHAWKPKVSRRFAAVLPIALTSRAIRFAGCAEIPCRSDQNRARQASALTTPIAAKLASWPTVVSVATVTARSGVATAVGVVTPAGSRLTPPAPWVGRIRQQPLSTAAQPTGSRQELTEDDDSDV